MSKQIARVRRGDGVLQQADLDLHAQDIRHRSITPTTHKVRDIFKDIADLQQAGTSSSVVPSDMSDAIFYMDRYHHTTWKTEILHFGINGHSAPMRSALALHNTAQQQKMVAASISAASNASKPSEYPKFVQQVTPTQYEQDLIQCAVQHLVTTG